MDINPAMPKAKKRKPRTRTKRVSSRPAILVSDLPAIHVDLRSGTESLVCPDCETWCPITGHDGGTPKLVPHHTGTAGRAEARRCNSSNRRVDIDVDITDWSHKIAEADATATGRRSGRVTRKPEATVLTPVHRLASMPGPSTRLLTVQAQARSAVNQHRSECKVCRTGQARCPIGRELEIRMGHTDAAVRLAHEQHEIATRTAAASAIPRAQQWRRVERDVHQTDKRRRQQPIGDVPQDSGSVPLKKLSPAHPVG